MEGSYKRTQFECNTDADDEAGNITNPENGQKNEINENPPKMVQRRFPSFTKNFVEYSSNSTIQGQSYMMGEKSASGLESYKITQFERKTDADEEAGKITNPENGQKNEINENPPKMVQRRFPSFTKNFSEYFVEYSSNSTIQGLSYMGDKARSGSERLVWLICFCISLYFCVTLVFKTYTKWKTSPVLVSFATKSTPIWKIPFPAVTICPDTKVRQTVYSYTENYHRMLENPGSMTDTEKRELGYVSMVCNRVLNGNLTTGYEAIDFLVENGPEYNEMMLKCKFPLPNNKNNCKKRFTPILTDEGICYTFNMLDRNEIYRDNVSHYGDFLSHEEESNGWSLETGYPENASLDTYPRRTVSARIQAGLELTLKNFVNDMDYVCKGAVQGFKIILHHPAEIPRFRFNFVRAPHMQEMIIAVKPEMITTSKDLKGYAADKRQCYFPEEKWLAFYRNYSQQNCEMECITNYTLKTCKCVGFDMPHIKGTRICGPSSIGCMHDAQDEILRREVESIIRGKQESHEDYEELYDDYEESDDDDDDDDDEESDKDYKKLDDDYEQPDDYKESNNDDDDSDDDYEESGDDVGDSDYQIVDLYDYIEGSGYDIHKDCDCLPGCTSLVYNTETSQSDINKDKFLKALKLDVPKFKDVQFSNIHIFFKEQQFITSERTELYSSTEFLSNCGGILGLFTGFSFLSIVEILYFLSLRIFCNIKRYGKHYWSGSQELVTNEKYDHEK